MGSPLRLQAASEVPGPVVDAAWRAIVDEFEQVEQALSRFRDTSEIHRIRLAHGRADAPSRRLVAALTAADRARRITGGRFDPRVLLDLERLGSLPLDLPSVAPGSDPAAGRESAPRRDSSRRVLTRVARHGPIHIPSPVDFGGIGKGLALRWAARRAATLLAGAPFLLEAGGDIVAGGAPGAHGWRVGIERPTSQAVGSDGAHPDGPIVVAELPRSGGAIATSSIRLARWETPTGQAVHHLIDPRTGEPAGGGLLAVTVQASDPAWAEVWSKALFVEGARAIAPLARARGLAAWWVTTDATVEMTPAARQRTLWVEAEGKAAPGVA